MILEKLIARLGEPKVYNAGISGEDIKKLKLTPELEADILAAINSTEARDIRMGLFFAKCLAIYQANDSFKSAIVDASIKLSNSTDSNIKSDSLSLLFSLGQKMKSYRPIMLEALGDKDPLVRGVALAAYSSYAKENEYKPLEQFESDDYLTEIGMGSHLVYTLRNQALETIEKITNKTFRKSEKTEILGDGLVAFWWDWEPFHKWRNKWWRIA